MRRLPFDSVETNIKGVYSLVPPPRGRDLLNADRATLLKHGVLVRRPDPEREPGLFRLWKRFVTEIWTEDNYTAPIFKPARPSIHNLKGPFGHITQNNVNSANWSGVVLRSSVKQPWVGATGIWNVPELTVPPGGGTGGTWFTSSWVGLDGAGNAFPGLSLDVLQAGVQQDLYPSGASSYYAWFEWYTPAISDQQALDQYPYLAAQRILTVPVQPGDVISVAVQYVRSIGDEIGNPAPPPRPYHFGALLLVNVTTSKSANVYFPPPPQSKFAGDTAEWIMELGSPTFPVFRPVVFRNAGACDALDAPPAGFAGTQLQNGTVFNVEDASGHIETNASGTGGQVTIPYVP
jgi:hypothetical protein